MPRSAPSSAAGPESNLDAADATLVRRFDESMDAAAGRAGPLFGCGPGTSRCCRGPFPITLLDARRLRRGMIELARRAPERASAVRRRAAKVVRRFWKDFPGEAGTGVLGSDEESTGQFLGRHGGLMCPALDTSTRRCEVYEWRPLACRAMGPPVRLRGADLAPCPYCFGPASPADVERCRATPDPDGQEGVLLDELQSRGEPAKKTLIPFALLQDPSARVAGRPRGLPD